MVRRSARTSVPARRTPSTTLVEAIAASMPEGGRNIYPMEMRAARAKLAYDDYLRVQATQRRARILSIVRSAVILLATALAGMALALAIRLLAG